MTFVKRFLVALVMTFSIAAMTTYSSSAAAKGVEVSGEAASAKVIELLNSGSNFTKIVFHKKRPSSEWNFI